MPPNHRQLLAEAQLLLQQNQLPAAERCLRELLTLRPRDTDALLHLGLICTRTARLPEAIDFFKQAIALKPYFFEANGNLACVLQLAGRHVEAIAAFQQLLMFQPQNPVTHYNLGISYKSNHQSEEAMAAYRRAIELKPDYADAWFNLGNVLRGARRLDEAAAAYAEALRLNPRLAGAVNNLGHVFKEKGQYEEAIAQFQHALAIKPGFADAIGALANVFRDVGRVEESFPFARQAMEKNPADPVVHSVYISTFEYLTNQNSQAIYHEYVKWGQRHAPPASGSIAHPNDRTPDRRLRIGYVSPDFRRHAVSHFIEGLLESHDPSVVEVFCYSDTAHPDAITDRLKSYVPHWRDTPQLSYEGFAQAVRDDRIDILIDLAGHTAGNRLIAFGMKPAPVQITYLGYPDTTGVSAIHYRLSDALADPAPDSDPFHTEELIRLPGTFLNYRPPDESPDVGPLPALAGGGITFGSFNVLPKITPQMIETWAAILNQVPSSRLLLKNRGLQSPMARDRLLNLFAKSDISPERLIFRGRIESSAEHLNLYNQIDIALDTFPYHGTTTTCEALWMGVPVVSLIGKRHVSRVGLSLLTNVGMCDLATETPEQYTAAAVRLASDLPELAELRASLRNRMKTSPLMDKRGFARSIESTYRIMWQRWLSQSAIS